MLEFIVTIPSPAAAIAILGSAKDVGVAGLILQPRGTNNAKSYFGLKGCSASAYMIALAPGDASDVPPAPVVIIRPDGSLGQLSQYYLFGTAGEIVHVTVIPR